MNQIKSLINLTDAASQHGLLFTEFVYKILSFNDSRVAIESLIREELK